MLIAILFSPIHVSRSDISGTVLAPAADGSNAGEQSAWEQINQEIARPAGWRQIVIDSAFQIGDSIHTTDAKGKPVTIRRYGTYPSLDGSTVAVPMAMEFARQHLSLSEADLESFIFFTTTHSAYQKLIYQKPNITPKIPSEKTVMDAEHPVDLIIVTAPSDEELALADEYGMRFVMEPVCLDAFVFITHKDNPVESLTVDQIRKIYSGEITNWTEVGGEDRRIAAYQREKNSGSQTAMENLVMQGAPLADPPKGYASVGMGTLVEVVANYQTSQTSLGYTYKYYIDTLYRNDNIKVLHVEGIEPSPKNLRSGAYPFTTAYYAVIRGGERSEVAGRFLSWMLSSEGQQVIEQAGYIPVLDIR
ncbi:MAG: substrate-binding domain-containing protein [Firmicutes bacterium]|nr:substrate-binding domain-containing protein [Bacillota bacterium]